VSCVLVSCCRPAAVLQPPRPSLGPLGADSGGLGLSLRWPAPRGSSDVHEIQVGRAERRTVVYHRNLTLSSDAAGFSWTWTSDVPLECVDHSVRLRRFYNRTGPSPWSDWVTHYGARVLGATRIFPSQRVLMENASAAFCCVPPRGVVVTGMTFNDRERPLLAVGAAGVKVITVRRLTVPTTFIKVVSLSCSDARRQISYAWNYVSFPPQRPGNLSCSTSDMVTVLCRWDTGRRRDASDRNTQMHTLHVGKWDRAPVRCEAGSPCAFPAVPQREEYDVTVVARNRLGEATASCSFNISDRVFPEVEVVRVSPGASHATVSWLVRGNLTRLELLCEVTAQPGGGRTRLSCGGGAGGVCGADVERLLPNTFYSTRVRCSAGGAGRPWGEWTRPVSFSTAPLVSLDVWRRVKRLPDPDARLVTLLWIPRVPGSAAAVSIRGYVVRWSQGGRNRTERTGGGRTRAEVSVDAGRHDFAVRAVVPAGCSAAAARLTVPRRGDDDDDDGEVVPAEKRSSGSRLSWDAAGGATCGYVVEWCVLGNAAPCDDADVRWMKLPEGNNTLVLAAGRFKAGRRYRFNIYGCTAGGHRLLEVQTGYSRQLQSLKPPGLVEPARVASSSATLAWTYSEDDPEHPAFITGYLVTAREAESGRVDAPAVVVVVADPRRKSVTIEGLRPDREYALSVSALGEGGPGEAANATARTTSSHSAQLAKILTPVLLLLGCSALVWLQRRTLKEVFVYPAGMNVKTPELAGFLRETGERLQAHEEEEEEEECSSCDIEILTPGGLEASPLRVDYCPQHAAARRPITRVTNQIYLHTDGLEGAGLV
ncbi:leukemia inhibitory factor receptor, partial [Clinocottus analis]|uniref:leukemia inhibitory factor receptor n=1 Tax=Clinocottus analis TaxID=304258 RepID=UPI0035C223C9